MTTVQLDSLEEILVAISGDVRAGLEQKAIEVESTAKRLASTPGAGKEYLAGFVFKVGPKWYKVPAREAAHRAALPGQPPAPDTGHLRGSIRHEIVDDGEVPYAKISANVFYAVYQELGTKLAPPHPFLRPALYSVGGSIPEDAPVGPAFPVGL